MDEQKFKELAEAESKQDITVMSPFFIQQLDAKKNKTQLFFLAFQDDSLKITKIVSDSNYDTLWQKGTDEAKVQGGFWSIFDSSGRFVDGNVVSR